ncbi:7,8-dihydropterin-6-yl-methyl-4-(beta-D-ribofuranosyl)aminobenzene 5'-phosphate synthase [Polaribacter sp. KT25b]|uniref:MBL fold metallo-hydrolase n=1 Tax=Polaribacter sp. KT25b TaxID=1855336 RepID=UPI00087B0F2E|nr:MBL fold metallo-hydrolase [Polaribacter sp. KT25b]SDS01907.1 7,8-dihydropterin-6-yl-methyl-4-(beta-D-ribofuranosyl)aminobenzene 5'-phosphate synthase [Polaribacter sp. KT25b]
MKLTVLTENCAGSGFLAEHGLSYLIENEKEKFLFDTGATDVFLINAQKLGIDIQQEVETVVLSHGHWDHGNGLEYISNKTLITHPNVFMKRYRQKEDVNIGLKLSKKEIEKKFTLILSKRPYYLSDNIIFLGEIPKVNDFEAKETTFSDKLGQPDIVKDDSAIVVIQNNEIIVITGCSHAGVCNIIEYACKVTKIKNVKAVIGGFHLKQNNLQTQETIKYLKEKNIKKIYPSHCTQFPALVAFNEVFHIEQVKTGMILNF